MPLSAQILPMRDQSSSATHNRPEPATPMTATPASKVSSDAGVHEKGNS